MVDFRITVVVDPSQAVQGSRRVQRQLQRVGNEADRLRTTLRRALTGFGVAFAVRELIQLTDGFLTLRNRIRTVIDDQDSVNAAIGRLSGIATRTRTSLEGLTRLYQRGAIAADELGASNAQLFTFVERVGQALAIQGGATVTARGALIQLSQALSSGIVRAEEFNSILEGAFPVAQAAARGIDRASGSVARLRTLIINGQVTSTEFFEGFLKGSEGLGTQFGRTTATIGQGFVVLRDSLIIFLGSLDSVRTGADAVARGLIAVAKNLDEVAEAAGLAGIALGIAFGPRVLSLLVGITVAALRLTLALGPIGLIALAFTGLAVAVQQTQGSLFEFEGQAVRIGDVVRATFSVALDLFQQAAAVITATLTPAFSAFGQEVGSLSDILSVSFNATVSFVDKTIGLFVGLQRAVRAALGGIPAIFARVFGIGALNAVTEAVENIVNTVSGTFNSVFSRFGIELGTVSLDRFRESAGRTAGEIVADVRQAFSSGLELTILGDLVDTIGDEAVAIARAREERAKLTDVIAEGNDATKRNLELTSDQVDTLQDLRDRLQPMVALQREFKEEQVLLNEALKLGALNTGDYALLTRRLATEFSEARDELRLELNPALQRQADLLEEIQGPAEEYGRNVEALGVLFREGKISAEEFTRAIREQRIALLETETDGLAGFERGLLSLADEFGNFSDLIADTISNSFKGAEDALVEFFTTGKNGFKGLVDSILADLTRLAVRESITAPLANLISGSAGGITGALGGVGSFGGGGFNLGSIFSALPGFQNGADFTVPGGGGRVDNNVVAFRADSGERVQVTPKGEGGGGTTIVQNYTITTPDANSFRRSQGQLLAQGQAGLARASRRNR